MSQNTILVIAANEFNSIAVSCQFPFLVNAVNEINGTPSVVSFHSMYTLQSNLMETLSVVSLNAVVDNNRWLHAWVLGHFSLPEFHNSNAWLLYSTTDRLYPSWTFYILFNCKININYREYAGIVACSGFFY